MNENIKKEVLAVVFKDVRYIIEGNLSGVPKPSFDFGKIDYRIDNLDIRIIRITEGIMSLVYNALIPKLDEVIENKFQRKSNHYI